MDATFATTHDALRYATGGNATLTVESVKTGTHYTFRLRRPDPREGDPREPPIFVSALTGADNTADYRYFGLIRGRDYRHGGPKAKIADKAPCATAFAWVWAWLRSGADLPVSLRVYHDGTCGRCGRVLTTPESVTSGFGPECRKHL